jgi:hypothetical protein
VGGGAGAEMGVGVLVVHVRVRACACARVLGGGGFEGAGGASGVSGDPPARRQSGRGRSRTPCRPGRGFAKAAQTPPPPRAPPRRWAQTAAWLGTRLSTRHATAQTHTHTCGGGIKDKSVGGGRRLPRQRPAPLPPPPPSPPPPEVTPMSTRPSTTSHQHTRAPALVQTHSTGGFHPHPDEGASHG